jgi:general stress protein 26
MNQSSAKTERLYDLMKGFSTAMLVTHGASGSEDLHARPMVIADVTGDLELWFVTGEDSLKVHEIVEDMRAHVVCQRDHSAYLSLAGTATVLRDRNRVRDLWSESFRVWFPEGKDDPDLVLIRFRPERAEYWDNTGFNKIAYMWDAARAYVTGKPPKVRDEAHGVVTLG